MNDAPVSWSGRAKGAIERLRVGDNAIDGLTLEARTAHLAKSPDLADLEIHVASIHAGTTQLGAIAIGAAVRGQAISAKATLASPEAVDLTLSGTLDTEPHSLALEFFTVRFPDVLWSTDGDRRTSASARRLSLTNFRLRSQGQTIAIDASKTGDAIDAHLAVQSLRLALLPHILVDPSLHLGGLVDADVRAGGTTWPSRASSRASSSRAGARAAGRASTPSCARRWPTGGSMEAPTSMRRSARWPRRSGCRSRWRQRARRSTRGSTSRGWIWASSCAA